MKSRTVELTFEKAKELYNKVGVLKETVLQAFSKDELTVASFKEIVTVRKACKATGQDYSEVESIFAKIKATCGVAAAYQYLVQIVRKALNKGYNMELTEGTIWYPYNPFITAKSNYYDSEIRNGSMTTVVQFYYKEEKYSLLGGDTYLGSYAGLGAFYSNYSVGFTLASVGFLGCATEKIAQHFSKYFAKEIFNAKFGDIIEL